MDAVLGSLSPSATLYEAVGCDRCLEGYRGRLGLFEYMGVGNRVADCIRHGDLDVSALRSAALDEGAFESLAADAARKLAAGATDIRETQTAVL